jgi:hypothetical protein
MKGDISLKNGNYCNIIFLEYSKLSHSEPSAIRGG